MSSFSHAKEGEGGELGEEGEQNISKGFHQQTSQGEEGRRLKKLFGKSNWFKKAKRQQEERKREKRGKKRSNQSVISPSPPLLLPKPKAVSFRGDFRGVRRGSLS